VRVRPTVGVVHQQQHATVSLGAQVLAALRRWVGVGAVHGVDHQPAGVGGLGGEPGCQPGLPDPAGTVQPAHGQPAGPVPPAEQLRQVRFAAGEFDDRTAGVEHPAGLGPQPGRVLPGRVSGGAGVEQVDRGAVAEDVDVGPDRAVREPGDGPNLLVQPTGRVRLGAVHRQRLRSSVGGGTCPGSA
jgi:hypothetical protein